VTTYRSAEPELPVVPPGTVLDLAPGEWEYGHRRLRLHVERLRADLARYYGGTKIWVEGHEEGDECAPIRRLQVLVPVAVLAQQVGRGSEPAR
jgi:hypothetical protein